MRNAVYNLYGYGGIAASPESADSQVLEALTVRRVMRLSSSSEKLD